MSKATAAAATTNTTTIKSASGVTFKKPERAKSEGDAATNYVRLGQLSEGDVVVEGIYMGTSQNYTYPEKLDFNFKAADGSQVIVNEGGNLKARLKDIEAGTLVLITYQGMQTIAKGPRMGKKAHNVEVLIAE